MGRRLDLFTQYLTTARNGIHKEDLVALRPFNQALAGRSNSQCECVAPTPKIMPLLLGLLPTLLRDEYLGLFSVIASRILSIED